MKWIIASDIHGSAHWCRRLLEAFEREGADRLMLLGDILYHGPRNPLPEGYAPAEVAAMLNSMSESICCVQGNCDSQVDQMVLDFPIMADYALLSYKERLIYFTHGHIHSSEQPPKLKKGDILVHGHTHVSVCEDHGYYTYLNPGSASLPKAGYPHSYLVFENGVFTWKDMDGTSFKSFEIQ